MPLVAELFERLYNRRMLVRLIGIRYSTLVSGNHQLNLFDDGTRYSELYTAMDKIRQRFGDRAVMRAIALDARTIGRWNPFNGEPPPLLANRRV
jgi:DNA polymerase-4